MTRLESIIVLVITYIDLVTAVASVCNPLSATASCQPNTALATGISETFETESRDFSNYTTSGRIEYGSEGVSFTLNKRWDNPALMSNFYIMFGKVEVVLKAASGTGIVSSFYLQSDALDEIDFEWLGGDRKQFQTNFFSKGDVTTYARGAFHPVNDSQAFHTYAIDWRMDQTIWYLDGKVVRTLSNTTYDGYPQTPMRIYMGIWAGGDPSNQPGTIQWAGGLTDYSKVPFVSSVKKVLVTDYSTGEKYVYTDKTGTWNSIKSEKGVIYGRFDEASAEFDFLLSEGDDEEHDEEHDNGNDNGDDSGDDSGDDNGDCDDDENDNEAQDTLSESSGVEGTLKGAHDGQCTRRSGRPSHPGSPRTFGPPRPAYVFPNSNGGIAGSNYDGESDYDGGSSSGNNSRNTTGDGSTFRNTSSSQPTSASNQNFNNSGSTPMSGLSNIISARAVTIEIYLLSLGIILLLP
ncbi:transglycosylase Ecym_5432 [Eremothecium cymbalariae DBVPG|uniref:Crh-like protein n=1 Tax=Eremothecium cymbalariae (strain CBS 270.75 / DBVPG 7215 / KCTC 17166 / NRRL Y-17582) TaxID=931890 RepID=I6NDP3_ERECY|nr:hypothetical protein Ecym_5432 [Eremothecium cymbalariae DBVPG\